MLQYPFPVYRCPNTHFWSPRLDMFQSLSEYKVLAVDTLGLGIGPDGPFKQAVLISPLLCLLICWVCTLKGCYLHTSDPVEPSTKLESTRDKHHWNTSIILLNLNEWNINWAWFYESERENKLIQIRFSVCKIKGVKNWVLICNQLCPILLCLTYWNKVYIACIKLFLH